MQDNGNEGGDGGAAVAAPDDGYMAVPRFDDQHYERNAGPVYSRLGWPKDAKGYEFQDPEGFEFSDSDREMRDSFKTIAHRLHLTGRQAKGLHDWQVAQAKLARDAEKAGRDEGGKRARAELEREWGRDFSDQQSRAQASLNHYAGRDAGALAKTKLADGSVLGDKIEFVRMLARIGTDAPPPTNPGSAAEAKEQIEKIQQEATRQGLDPGHQNWPHKQLERLYGLAYGTKPLRTDGLHED